MRQQSAFNPKCQDFDEDTGKGSGVYLSPAVGQMTPGIVAIVPTKYGRYAKLAEAGLVILPDSEVLPIDSSDYTIHVFKEQTDLDDFLFRKEYIVTEDLIRSFFASKSNEGRSDEFLDIKSYCAIDQLFYSKTCTENLLGILANIPDIRIFADKEPWPVPDTLVDSNRGKVVRISESGRPPRTGIFLGIDGESYWNKRIILYNPYNDLHSTKVTLALMTDVEILTDLTPEHADELFYHTSGKGLVLEKLETKTRIECLKCTSEYWECRAVSVEPPEGTKGFPTTYYRYVFFEGYGRITRVITLDAYEG